MENKKFNLLSLFLSIILILLFAIIIFFLIYIYKDVNSNKETISYANAIAQEEISLVTIPENNIQNEEVVSMPSAIEDTPTEEVSNNQTKFYYNQLDQYSKLIYDGMESQKDSLKSGNSIITLPSKIGEIIGREENTETVQAMFSIAVNAFEYDNPELFYLDVSKLTLFYEGDSSGIHRVYLKNANGDENYLMQGFNSEQDVLNAIQEIESLKEEIINSINDLNLQTDYEKILYVHDWLVDNIEYDQTLQRINRSNIYGAFIEKNVTCAGYAKAFKYMMDELNINSIIVQGTAIEDGEEEYHAWNYVELDGTWYAIDCTWDDPIIRGTASPEQLEQIQYVYFLKGQNAFEERHTPFESFYGTDVKINYPELSLNDY